MANPTNKWIFPGLTISLLIFAAGLFWFGVVVLKQFQTSNKELSFSLASPRWVAKSQGLSNDPLLNRYIKEGQYQRVIDLLKPRIQELKDSGKEDSLLADHLLEVGKCYLTLGQYTEAQPYYRQALSIYNKLGQYQGSRIGLARRQYADVLKHLGHGANFDQLAPINR